MKRVDIEECLEIVWHLKENNESDLDSFLEHDIEHFGEESIRKLERDGYVTVKNKKISLTPKGETEAQQIVRRHRLAERLLSDVLGMKPDEVEKGACEFEHILAPELTESICTLLGHPRLCPHGTRIPEGDCCREQAESVNNAVMPLTKAKPGESYKVAYINTQLDARIQKLFHFKIFPGSVVRVSQKYPSYVIHCGNIQVAMEENITNEIYVWRNDHASRRKGDNGKEAGAGF